MQDELTASSATFTQDRKPWIAPAGARPGCRRLEGVRIVVVRHRAGSSAARAAVTASGLAWPVATGDVAAAAAAEGLFVVRRQPEEALVIGPPVPAFDMLLAALAPGCASAAVALELSDGMVVVALEGPRLDDWLARLVDALAIPRTPGKATRTRLADVAVLLVRLDADRLWLVADRSLAPYLASWLAFAHDGAFASAEFTP
jgi:heterotetrameric sarcosine oxidase gamma subunit